MRAADFLTIAANIREGGVFVEFDPTQAQRGTPPMPNRIVLFGQMLASGTALPNVPVRLSANGQEWVPAFGLGSQLERMASAARAANPWSTMWAVPLADNPAGTAAIWSIKTGGPATSAGTQNVYLNGDATMFGFLVQVGVTNGMTAAAFATALAAAVNAAAGCPYTAAVDGVDATKVNLTAIHKGADFGNNQDIRTTYYAQDANVPGLSFTIAQGTPGAGNPSLTAAIAACQSKWFSHWAVPYTDGTSLAAIDAELDRRFSGMVMQEGHAYTAYAGTTGQQATFGETYNTLQPTCWGLYKFPSPNYMVAAVSAAVIGYNVGIDPARGLKDLILPGIGAPAPADRLQFADRNNLLFDGIASLYVDDNGNVCIGGPVTMYRNNSAGVADTSYLFAETLYTIFWMRWSLRVYLSNIYKWFKIADDGTPIPANSRVTTPSLMAGSVLGLAERDWLGYVLQDLKGFEKSLKGTSRDPDDPYRVNIPLGPNLIAQLRTTAAQIQFVLGTAQAPLTAAQVQ